MQGVQLGPGHRDGNTPPPSAHRLSWVGSPPATRETGSASTWAIEGVAQPVVVVPLEEGEADVSGAGARGLPELQGRDVAPHLEGGAHGPSDRRLRQVLRPVHQAVGEVLLVPLVACHERGPIRTQGWAQGRYDRQVGPPLREPLIPWGRCSRGPGSPSPGQGDTALRQMGLPLSRAAPSLLGWPKEVPSGLGQAASASQV